LVATTVNLTEGATIAFVPATTTQEEARQFGAGKFPSKEIPLDENKHLGVLPPDVESYLRRQGVKMMVVTDIEASQNALAEVASGFLGLDERHIFVMEKTYSRRSDPWLQETSWGRFITHREELLSYVTRENLGNDSIIQSIRHTMSAYPPLVGMFTSFSRQVSLTHRITDIPTSLLEELVRNMCGLAIGCYDGESFLLWSKAGGDLSMARGGHKRLFDA
jgi:hypothetical protein